MSLESRIPDIIKKVGYSELYGFDFTEQFGDAHKQIIKKFLVANKDDVDAAAAQLEKTLKWRKEFEPLKTLKEEHGDLNKLAVLTLSPSGKVVTWNLYGAARSTEERAKLFGELEKFLRWRVSVMERGIRLMDFSNPDTAYMDQVHDYKDVSFLRLDGATKKASSTTIKLFQDYYPEFLSAKYFVNVPKIMTWMFGLARAFMSQETADKFHVVGNGKELRYSLGEWIPSEYGGNATSLSSLAAKESTDSSAIKSGDKVAETETNEPAKAAAPSATESVEHNTTAPTEEPGSVTSGGQQAN